MFFLHCMGKAVAKSGIGFYLFLLKLAPLGKELQWLFRKHSNCAFFFFFWVKRQHGHSTHIYKILCGWKHTNKPVLAMRSYIFTNCNPTFLQTATPTVEPLPRERDCFSLCNACVSTAHMRKLLFLACSDVDSHVPSRHPKKSCTLQFIYFIHFNYNTAWTSHC